MKTKPSLAAVFLLCLSLAATALAQSGGVWDPRTYGAKADGATLDTKPIQSAVDACFAAGGGTVNLHGGVFLSGTICLRSNVTLNIAAGATLLGSPRIEDYPSFTPQIQYLYRDRFTKSLIFAEGQENIALTGQGLIDGQGKLFPAKKGDDGLRPYLLRFSECRHVQVRGLHLHDSARWLSHYLACENVTIEGVTIHSRIRANRDGMDIDSCDRVRIANCDIFSGDDAIVLKSTANRPCRRVAVVNCTLSSSASALKLGTESQGGFEDITFDNCVIYDNKGTAICLGEVDGGICERINVSNIVMKDVGEAIFVRLGNRANPIPGQPTPPCGAMRDIMISNIQADGVKATGSSITGLPGHPVENVLLENIRIRYAGGAKPKDALRVVAEKETGYPNGDLFGALPAYGFYCRHVKGLRLHNLDLAFAKDDARPAIVADDVSALDLSSLRAQLSTNATSMIRLHNVQDALISACQPPKETLAFLHVSGPATQRIALRGNDLTGLKHHVLLETEVPATVISEDLLR